MAIDRTGWQGTLQEDVVEAVLEVSLDGGTTWFDAGGYRAGAGDVRQRNGMLSTESACLFRTPEDWRRQQCLVRIRQDILHRELPGEVLLLTSDDLVAVRVPGNHASVTYDSDGETTGTAVSSLTISSLVIAANTNRYLAIGSGSWDATSANSQVSSITWNGSGTGLAVILDKLDTDPAWLNRASVWGLKNPTATTANVVVTMGGTCAEVGSNATSLWDVDQTTPYGTPVGSVGYTTTVSTTVSAATGGLVYDALYYGSGNAATIAVGAGQTERANSIIYPGGFSRLGASTEAGAASVDMTWTSAGTTPAWAQVAVPFNVTAAAGWGHLLGSSRNRLVQT